VDRYHSIYIALVRILIVALVFSFVLVTLPIEKQARQVVSEPTRYVNSKPSNQLKADHDKIVPLAGSTSSVVTSSNIASNTPTNTADSTTPKAVMLIGNTNKDTTTSPLVSQPAKAKHVTWQPNAISTTNYGGKSSGTLDSTASSSVTSPGVTNGATPTPLMTPSGTLTVIGSKPKGVLKTSTTVNSNPAAAPLIQANSSVITSQLKNVISQSHSEQKNAGQASTSLTASLSSQPSSAASGPVKMSTSSSPVEASAFQIHEELTDIISSLCSSLEEALKRLKCLQPKIKSEPEVHSNSIAYDKSKADYPIDTSKLQQAHSHDEKNGNYSIQSKEDGQEEISDKTTEHVKSNPNASTVCGDEHKSKLIYFKRLIYKY